jgi:hypothetical protein
MLLRALRDAHSFHQRLLDELRGVVEELVPMWQDSQGPHRLQRLADQGELVEGESKLVHPYRR